jgi:hypothetical protein
MMEVTEREYWKPSSLIWVHTVDKHEWHCKFPFVLPGDDIHHRCGMLDGKVPIQVAFASLFDTRETYAPLFFNVLQQGCFRIGAWPDLMQWRICWYVGRIKHRYQKVSHHRYGARQCGALSSDYLPYSKAKYIP